MNKYESVIIINPNLEEEAIKSLIEKISNLINTDGKVSSVEEAGKKKLAYEIRKNNEGHYLVYQFQVEEKMREFAIREIERFYRITDEVIKFLIIKL